MPAIFAMYVNVYRTGTNMENHATLRRLNSREKSFIRNYLTAATAKEAAAKAGYISNPASQASRLLRRRRIQDAIQAERKALAVRNNIDQNKLVSMLLTAYHQADMNDDANEMRKAAREIGLLCGLYPQSEY